MSKEDSNIGGKLGHGISLENIMTKYINQEKRCLQVQE